MKKLYFLLLLCCAAGFAQPAINANPQPLTVCDDNNDGYASFDLATAIPDILSGLDPSTVTITFHSNQSDAENDSGAVTPSPFFNSDQNSQMVYARVEDNANPSQYAVAYLNLVVNAVASGEVTTPNSYVCVGSDPAPVTFGVVSGASVPLTITYTINGGAPQTITSNTNYSVIYIPTNAVGTYVIDFIHVENATGCGADVNSSVTVNVQQGAFAYQPSDIVVDENPNDGFATFDLTQNDAAITNGIPGTIVAYFTSEASALSGSPAIANPSAYNNITNPQTIWARATNAISECSAITSFDIAVNDPNNVYIPDPAFKAAVIGAGYDTNQDGEIQVAEAAASLSNNTLSIDALNIHDLTGIKSFTALVNLYAMGNQLTTLDLSGMTSLHLVYVGQNALTTINLNGVSNLQDLVLDQNQLTSLTLANMPNLDRFSAINNQLNNLFLSNLPELREINVYGNQLVTMDVSAFPGLEKLFCASNQIATLNVIGAPLLKTLDFSDNNVSNVNVAGFSNLEVLYFNSNPVQSHAWSGLSALKFLQFNDTGISVVDFAPSATLLGLQCAYNNIASLDVSIYPSLTSLYCNNNQLSALDVTALQNLFVLECSNNSIETLDLNNNTALNQVVLFNNDMQTLFAKNGSIETFSTADFVENSFVYICADEEQVDLIQSLATDAQVNSYCSFTPGGVYNTIAGTVKFDAQADGCDASDIAQPLIKVHMENGSDQEDVFTNDLAGYNFYVGSGNYAVNPVFENNYFTVSPSVANVNFPAVDNSVATENFCLTADGVNPDAEIAVFAVVPARPGFDAVYRIVVRNKGNQVLSQPYGISFFYDENVMDFISATTTPATTGSGALTWNYTNLQPFESRSIEVTVNINAPTDTPAVNIDDPLTFTTNIIAAGDVDATDNTFVLNQTVVGAFDPNNKECLQGEIVSPTLIGDFLYYVINFENTGNFMAENIVVKDVLNPSMYDRSSLVILGSSHPVVGKSNGNGTVFIFQSINLDSGGHGNILLRVKTLPGLHIGDTVSNRADIYFDYNEAITTDFANTTFQALSVNDPEDVSIQLYPNPVGNSFDIKADTTINSVQLFDLQGRLLQVKTIGATEAHFDVSDRSTGVYFVKIATDKGVKVEKVVKK